jgi:hypothetical protein
VERDPPRGHGEGAPRDQIGPGPKSWSARALDPATTSADGPILVDGGPACGAVAVSDEELRVNHEFVTAFETLRKQHGHREMHDLALRDVARSTGLEYETLRVARHLRNALAHGENVNRATLARYLSMFTKTVGRSTTTPASAVTMAPSDFAPRAYRVHAWQDPRLEQEMIANGFVAVGGAEIGDLTGVDDPEFIRSCLTKSMPDRTPRAIALFVGYWRRFLWDATPGDLVVLPTRDRHVAIGELVGPYHYVDNVEPRARHRRPVAWVNTGVARDAFGRDLLVTLNGHHTVQEFTAPEAASRLKALADTDIDPGPT